MAVFRNQHFVIGLFALGFGVLRCAVPFLNSGV